MTQPRIEYASDIKENDGWADAVAIIAMSTRITNGDLVCEHRPGVVQRERLIEAAGAYMAVVAPPEQEGTPTLWERAKLFDLLDSPEARMEAIGHVIQDIIGFKYFAGDTSLTECVEEIEEMILNERKQLKGRNPRPNEVSAGE